MNTEILDVVSKSSLKKRPEVKVGDTVKLYTKISEGDKTRTQVFEGIVLSLKGSGLNKTITVRKMSYGVGVERIFPLHAPALEKIEVIKRGKVRKSKLFYMKRKVGKRALRVTGIEDVFMTDEVDEPATEPESEETVKTDEAETPEEPKEQTVEKETVKE